MGNGKILVIDDEEDIREELQAFLEQEGFQVSTAVNGVDGVFVFERDKPDLVLSDFRMPRMDGIGALRRIKEINSSVPVIMFSGHADMRTCVDALNQDAYEFLEKPVDLDRLLESIQRARKGRAAWWNQEVDIE